MKFIVVKYECLEKPIKRIPFVPANKKKKIQIFTFRNSFMVIGNNIWKT